MGFSKGQIPGQVHPDDLPAVARGGVQLPQGPEVAGHGPRLLLQLPDGGRSGVLAVFQLSGRNLPQDLFVGVAVLTHQQRLVLVVQGQHAHAAGVVHHLAEALASIGQLHRVPPDMQDMAVKDFLAG